MDLMSTAQLLGNIGEFVGALGVIGSLVYLAIQVRHGAEQSRLNTKAVEASAYNQTVVEISALGRTVVSEPEIREIIWKASRDPGSIEGADRILYRALLSNNFFGFENLFRLYEQGMIDEESWESSILNNRATFQAPHVRAFAESREGSLSKRFWAHVQTRLEHSEK